MAFSILLIIAGIAGVLWGADKFTDGAAQLARRMNVPQVVVGLTVVAFGTSAPELFVSMTSALTGAAGMAVGNVVGSNIFNVLLIVGASAAIAPMTVGRSMVKRDLPWAVGASAVLLLLCRDGQLSRMDSALLLLGMVGFMVYTLRQARQGSEETFGTTAATWKCVIWIIIGLLCLVIGSNIFVRGAANVAQELGVSDAVIGLTVVAGGTSLPELATSVVSARKGQSALALGNVVGSNVFNILLILGLTGIVQPLDMAGITPVDFALLIGSTLLLWWMTYTKYRVSRAEGIVLLLLFAAYMVWLVMPYVS